MSLCMGVGNSPITKIRFLWSLSALIEITGPSPSTVSSLYGPWAPAPNIVFIVTKLLF